MEENIAKGLPANADPSRWQPFGVRGVSPSGGIEPMGYRLIPSGFGGGWGSIGMDREPRSTGKLQQGMPLGSAGSSGYGLAGRMGGPQPAAGTTDIARGIAPSLGATQTPPPMSIAGGTTPSLGAIPAQPSMTIAGGIEYAPLAGPIPQLTFPTREDEILNPYGLRNY